MPGVRSPGAIRCGWVSWSGCPNWHSAADTSVLMAGETGLLMRNDEARGLGRHACMLAWRGRNRLLLMVVDMDRRKEEPQSIERSQVRRSSSRIGRHLSLSTNLLYSTVPHCGNTIIVAHLQYMFTCTLTLTQHMCLVRLATRSLCATLLQAVASGHPLQVTGEAT